MSIEEQIFQMAKRWGFEKPGAENDELFKAAIREALAEQAATHAIELRAYEATVENLEQRIRELDAQRVPVVGEPVAYLKSDVDGKVLWSEDCVCEDAVWTVPGEDSEFGEYSLPVYRKPAHSIPAHELDALRARLERAEDVLRTLASDLGAGGYNAESVDAEVFERKIRDGVSMLFNPLVNRLEQAEKERDELRKDAESYRRLISEVKKLGMQECVYPDCICPDGVSSGECNLGLPGATCRNDAIAGEKK